MIAGRQPAERETEIEFFRRQHGRCVVKLRGIDSISEAEKYVGARSKFHASELPPLQEGSVLHVSAERMPGLCGRRRVHRNDYRCARLGGTEILKVDRENEETLIPFAQAYLKKIDLDQRRIEVDLPEGSGI